MALSFPLTSTEVTMPNGQAAYVLGGVIDVEYDASGRCGFYDLRIDDVWGEGGWVQIGVEDAAMVVRLDCDHPVLKQLVEQFRDQIEIDIRDA